MDQNEQTPELETAIGTAVTFLIVLISALLMARYDSSGCFAGWMRSNAQDPAVATTPVPPL